jgi:outer membrane protein OmpA-like peptidoglycan-associated protein
MANDEMQSYGTPFVFDGSEFVVSGLKNGDTVRSVTLTSLGDTTAANVGSYTIAPSNPTGGTFKASNYTIVFVDGKLTVNPAILTAGLTGDVGKIFDGTTAADHLTPANYTLSGVIAGDNVRLNDPSSGTYASPNVGTGIPVSVSGLALSGSAAGNYVLASGSVTANIGTISPAPAAAAPPLTSVPSLATLVALVQSGQAAQPEAPETGQRKAGSPNDLALAAISIFRPSPCNTSSAPPALFVVLPSATGHAIGGVTVSNGAGVATLDQSFAAAELQGGTLSACRVSPTAVDSTFRQAIAARPMLPHQFRLYFTPGSDRLTPESLAEYRDALADIARRAVYQVAVIGFTDTVGSPGDDRQRSLAQASAIRRLLTQDRIDPRKISVAGRGKLDLLIPTPDQVAEPRNRRIEIWVR